MYTAKIKKILLITSILCALMYTDTSCRIFKAGFGRGKSPEAKAKKAEDKQKKKDSKAYRKGVKKYQKKISGGENEKFVDKKVYKRMKKNQKKARRINKGKHPDSWFVRTFRKNRVKEPFYKVWGKKIKIFFIKVFKRKKK